MLLTGRYLSPFVRRVATTLNLYDIAFENKPFATMGEQRNDIRSFNPLTRVPALQLNDGEILIDSSAIIDYLDELVGPERALTPPSGATRRRVLKLAAVATGAAEKCVLSVYERRFRPQDKWHEPWVDMVSGQASDALHWLDGEFEGPYMTGAAMTQADVSSTVVFEFVRVANSVLFAQLDCPNLQVLSERLSPLDAFQRSMP